MTGPLPSSFRMNAKNHTKKSNKDHEIKKEKGNNKSATLHHHHNNGDQRQGSRIPLALQAVFLASNRGNEVHKPPPKRMAQKTYHFRGWFGFGKKRQKLTKKKEMDKTTSDEKHEITHHQSDKWKQQDATNSNSNDANIMKNKRQTSNSQPSSSSAVVVKFGKNDKTAQSTESAELLLSNNTGRVISKEQVFLPKPKVQAKLTGRPPMSPQAYLDVLIHARGYSTRRYRTLQTGYYSKPTAFQQASYNVYLVKLVRANDVEALRACITAGISRNPCNAYGESLVHMVCRRGDHALLQMLLEVGTSIQVADDYGRTPLHDACWAATPSFETVELVADQDVALFHMTDSRGAVPLSYVRREHWPQWIDFIECNKDRWWPTKLGADVPAPLMEVAPNDRPIPDPPNPLSMELAKMVASGALSPDEALLLHNDEDDGDDDSSCSESDEEDDEDDDSDSDCSEEDSSDEEDDDDSDDDSSSSEDEDEDDLNGFSAEEMSTMLSMLDQHTRRKNQS